MKTKNKTLPKTHQAQLRNVALQMLNIPPERHVLAEAVRPTPCDSSFWDKLGEILLSRGCLARLAGFNSQIPEHKVLEAVRRLRAQHKLGVSRAQYAMAEAMGDIASTYEPNFWTRLDETMVSTERLDRIARRVTLGPAEIRRAALLATERRAQAA